MLSTLERRHLKMRRLVADMEVPRDPKVTFIGDYITKSELEVLIRAVRRAHKKLIHEYRRRKIIQEYEASKKEKEEVKNATDRKSESGSEPGESNGPATEHNSATKPIDAGDVATGSSTSAGSGSTVEAGQGSGSESGGSGEGSSSTSEAR